jgi:hypothetical protein
MNPMECVVTDRHHDWNWGQLIAGFNRLRSADPNPGGDD